MKTLKGVVTIVLALVYGMIYYFFLPPLSLAYISGFLFIGSGVVMAIALITLWFCGEDDDYNFTIPGIAFCIFL